VDKVVVGGSAIGDPTLSHLATLASRPPIVKGRPATAPQRNTGHIPNNISLVGATQPIKSATSRSGLI
jgi:hypothetical protein